MGQFQLLARTWIQVRDLTVGHDVTALLLRPVELDLPPTVNDTLCVWKPAYLEHTVVQTDSFVRILGTLPYPDLTRTVEGTPRPGHYCEYWDPRTSSAFVALILSYGPDSFVCWSPYSFAMSIVPKNKVLGIYSGLKFPSPVVGAHLRVDPNYKKR